VGLDLGLIDLLGCAPPQRTMGALGVVVKDEAFDLILERSERLGRLLFGQILLQGLVEALDLS